MNKINIENFLFKFVLSIDDQLLSTIKKALKSFSSFDDLEFAELNQKQKIQLLKIWDRVFKTKLLLPEAEQLFQTKINFEIFLKLMGFPQNDQFSQFWQHIQVVDQINRQIETNQLNQKDFDQLEQFFNKFGELYLNDQTLANVWQEFISHHDRQAGFNGLLGLLIFSVFAHLDILLHQWIFDDIEPICLGWLFSKKLNSRNYHWPAGKPQKINQHKGTWTNPSRALVTLIAVYLKFKSNDKMLVSTYGLEVVATFLGERDKYGRKGNFIKKANEGNSITYAKCLWLLSDKDKKTDIFDEPMQQKSLGILKKEAIPFLWLVYYLFQIDYESRPKNQAFLHGFYYEFWELFRCFYQKGQPRPSTQWPDDLIKLAQPIES